MHGVSSDDELAAPPVTPLEGPGTDVAADLADDDLAVETDAADPVDADADATDDAADDDVEVGDVEVDDATDDAAGDAEDGDAEGADGPAAGAPDLASLVAELQRLEAALDALAQQIAAIDADRDGA